MIDSIYKRPDLTTKNIFAPSPTLYTTWWGLHICDSTENLKTSTYQDFCWSPQDFLLSNHQRSRDQEDTSNSPSFAFSIQILQLAYDRLKNDAVVVRLQQNQSLCRSSCFNSCISLLSFRLPEESLFLIMN